MNLTYVWQQIGQSDPVAMKIKLMCRATQRIHITSFKWYLKTIGNKCGFVAGLLLFNIDTTVKFHMGIYEIEHKLRRQREGRTPAYGMRFGQNSSITVKLMSGEYIFSLEIVVKFEFFFANIIHLRL